MISCYNKYVNKCVKWREAYQMLDRAFQDNVRKQRFDHTRILMWRFGNID